MHSEICKLNVRKDSLPTVKTWKDVEAVALWITGVKKYTLLNFPEENQILQWILMVSFQIIQAMDFY